MAKGCVYYAVEKCNGGPWERVTLPFRSTPGGAENKFAKEANKIPGNYSVRLCEVKVLEQRNGVMQ